MPRVKGEDMLMVNSRVLRGYYEGYILTPFFGNMSVFNACRHQVVNNFGKIHQLLMLADYLVDGVD